MREGVGDRRELQHIDPHSYGHNNVSFPFSRAAQPGARPLWDMVLIPASSLQLMWTSTAQSGVLRAPSAGCWFSLPHLIPTDWTSSAPSYIIFWHPLFFLRASQFRTHSARPPSRLYPDYPRLDVPIIYTCAFSILTAWLGSICYNTLIHAFTPTHESERMQR